MSDDTKVVPSDGILGPDGNPALKLVSTDNENPETGESPSASTGESASAETVGVGFAADPNTGMIRLMFSKPVAYIDWMPPDWVGAIQTVLEILKRMMTGNLEGPPASPPADDVPATVVDAPQMPAHKD